MKNVFKPFCVIALVAIIGFSFAALSLTGCGGGDNNSGDPNPVMRTITFDANGGTIEGVPTKTVKVEYGKTVKAPADPVNSPKKFWGWFDGTTEGEYGNRFNPATPIIWDTTVFARWGDTAPPESFDLTFDANGGTYIDGKKTEIIQVYKDETAYPPSPTRDDGYMVTGWNSQRDGNGTAFDEDDPVTAALTVYAQWKKPEEMPDKDRWNVWRDSSSIATLEDYSIDDEGLCTVTVSGEPESNNHEDGWFAWKIVANYRYAGIAGKMYEYTFEAWTESGVRDLHGQYYQNHYDEVYISDGRWITTTPEIYTIRGQALPKSGVLELQFQLADQLGTVHIKMLGIKEYNVNDPEYPDSERLGDYWYYETYGKITITGYEGSENNITIPAQINEKPVTRIGDHAFEGCKITSVTIPNSVTSIEEKAFYYCTSLTSITIPNSVTRIGNDAFSDCYSLTSVTIGNGVTSIRDGAFFDCRNLTSITLPNSVTFIDFRAFEGCGLTNITIPDSVTMIEGGAFSYCKRLTTITVDAGNTAYTAENGILYNKNKTVLHTYPAGITTASFTIPDSVTRIRYMAFKGCDRLTSLTIPNSVTRIEWDAFFGCGLTSVTFQGKINPDNFSSNVSGEPSNGEHYIGDLRDKYLAGGIGRYTRPNNSIKTWTKH